MQKTSFDHGSCSVVLPKLSGVGTYCDGAKELSTFALRLLGSALLLGFLVVGRFSPL